MAAAGSQREERDHDRLPVGGDEQRGGQQPGGEQENEVLDAEDPVGDEEDDRHHRGERDRRPQRPRARGEPGDREQECDLNGDRRRVRPARWTDRAELGNREVVAPLDPERRKSRCQTDSSVMLLPPCARVGVQDRIRTPGQVRDVDDDKGGGGSQGQPERLPQLSRADEVRGERGQGERRAPLHDRAEAQYHSRRTPSASATRAPARRRAAPSG